MTLYWLHSHKSLINIQLLIITVIFLFIILPLTCFVRNRFLITFHIPDFHFDEIILWEIHSRKNTSRSFPHSWLITGFVNRLTRRVSLVEQELLTLPEHPSSPPGFSRVHVTQSLVWYVCFVDRCLSFCTFFFWSLCCLFFFDIRIMIVPLVSSNFSWLYYLLILSVLDEG